MCVYMCEKRENTAQVQRTGLVHTSPKLWALVWVTFSKMESEHRGLENSRLASVLFLWFHKVHFSLHCTSWRVSKRIPFHGRHPTFQKRSLASSVANLLLFSKWNENEMGKCRLMKEILEGHFAALLFGKNRNCGFIDPPQSTSTWTLFSEI